MNWRPSLLGLMAGAAGIAAIANGVSVASPALTHPRTAGSASRCSRSLAPVTAKRPGASARSTCEQAARATEARLKAGLEPQHQAATPSASAGARPEEEGDQYEDLARIYQAMKPAKAAAVFEQLDMDVQMKVAQRMRERSAGLILAAMTPKGAAALSMALARRQATRPPAPPPRRRAAAN